MNKIITEQTGHLTAPAPQKRIKRGRIEPKQ
jgi:hypothetical protein